jgi:hypothetical protein
MTQATGAYAAAIILIALLLLAFAASPPPTIPPDAATQTEDLENGMTQSKPTACNKHDHLQTTTA